MRLKNTKSLNLICRTTTGVKRPCQGLLERVPGIGSICLYDHVHESEAHDSMIWCDTQKKRKNKLKLDINMPILTYSKCLIFRLSSLKWTTLFETDTNRE